jgi:dolichol-phosphate mannosyltransferase
MKIALILLVRNERPCLELLFDKIPAPGPDSGFDLMVAVDGVSNDGTVEFLQEHGIEVVAQSKRGRGEAFQQAFKEVEADAYLFFSPDGNESINDLGRFRPLLEGGADIVIASRMMADSHNEEDDQFLRPRKWANNAFNWLANSLFRRSGPYIADSINGYRAITRAAADRLALDAPDYTIEYQMTIRALDASHNIVEFPTIEGARVAGDTGAPSIPTGLRFMRRLWWEWLEKGKQR